MPRNVEGRIAAMRRARPSRRGLCARTTWLACGGDAVKGSLDYLPALGAASATIVTFKVRASGHLHAPSKPGDAPRGSIMLWTGGSHGYGHMALSLGRVDGIHRTLTVDALGKPVADVPTVWIANNWGALRWAGWSTWYGVELPPLYPGTPLKQGSRGKPVVEIQRRLGVRQTGYFGELTAKAVNRHIRVRPWLLPADGIVGPRTYASITARKTPL